MLEQIRWVGQVGALLNLGFAHICCWDVHREIQQQVLFTVKVA